jgi:hypothetical protein
MRRTGRLLTHSMLETNSTFLAAPSAAVMLQAIEDIADQDVGLRRMRFGEHPLLAATITHHAQESRRERPGTARPEPPWRSAATRCRRCANGERE